MNLNLSLSEYIHFLQHKPNQRLLLILMTLNFFYLLYHIGKLTHVIWVQGLAHICLFFFISVTMYISQCLFEKQIDKIKRSEEKYRQLFNSASDAMFVSRLEGKGQPGRFIEVNQAACLATGYTREELLTIDCLKVIPKEMLPQFPKLFKEIYTKKNITFPSEHVRKDGSRLPVEVNAKYFVLDGKDVVLSIARDITVRNEIDRELRESEERYRTLVELSPDAVCVHDYGKIIFYNQAAAQIIGALDQHSYIGSSVLDFIHSDYKGSIRQKIYDIQDQGKEYPVEEYPLVRTDGSLVEVEIRSVQYIYKGKPVVLAIIRDITERRKAVEMKEKMEESKRILDETLAYDKLKTEFFSNLSHELRTPLNVMLSAIQLMDLESLDERAILNNRYMGMLKQNCYRLLRLVNNLIDITRMDSGFYELELRNHNIINIVEEITLSVAQYIENHSITLLFDTEIEEKIMACDPDKIERIILNLLSNAIKFTNPGGSITVNIYDKQDKIQVSIQDTGAGIPKDKLSMIFERFRQVDQSITRSQEGSGIGLSLVKSLVEMHKGRVFVQSEYGKGSEFIVELPVCLVAEEKVKNIEDHGGPSYMERINIEFSDIYTA